MTIKRLDTLNDVLMWMTPWLMLKDMRDELGEHPVWENGDTYFFIANDETPVSFACLSCGGKLKYAYTDSSMRGRGYFSTLMQVMEEYALSIGHKRITATATDAALPLYIKRGWTATKNWKKYHNIAKQLNA